MKYRFYEKGQGVLWWIVGIALVVIIVALFWPNNNAELNNVGVNNGVDLNTGIPTGDQEVTLEEVMNNPRNYIGRMVTFDTEIEEVLTDGIFVVDSPELAFDDNLLIVDLNNRAFTNPTASPRTTLRATPRSSPLATINASPSPRVTASAEQTTAEEIETVLEEGDNIRITGRVALVNEQEVEREVGGMDIDSEVFEGRENDPMIYATSITILD